MASKKPRFPRFIILHDNTVADLSAEEVINANDPPDGMTVVFSNDVGQYNGNPRKKMELINFALFMFTAGVEWGRKHKDTTVVVIREI